MTMRITLPALVAVALLGGCAVSREQAHDTLAAATPCCSSLQSLPYQPLRPGEKVVFDVDERSPSFVFPSGKSYFKAFALPENGAPGRIELRSYAQGDRIDRAHVFYPGLLMLDRDFRVVAEVVPALASARGTNKAAMEENSWGMPARLQGGVQIEPAYRYMIVRTTASLLAKHSSYLEPARGIGAAIGTVPQGQFAIAHSPVGRIVVELPVR
jgi:maltose operon protein